MSFLSNKGLIEITQELPPKLDTSVLYEELNSRYLESGMPVEVDFRMLANWVKLGDQLTHQIHPYPAKLLPNIANFFVNAKKLRKNGSTVLDPFCGSGTVALEASIAGCTPYVADANPLALLITKVKTTPYNTEELLETLDWIITRVKRIRSRVVIPVVNEGIWYSSTTKCNLEKIAKAIDEVPNESIRDFFKICFSVAAKKLSLADPAISVPVRLKIKDKFSDTVNKRIQERLDWIDRASPSHEFAKLCLANIDRVGITNKLCATRKAAQFLSNDARALSLSPGYPAETGIQLTVTSPPYGSAQKYIRASSISLNWLKLSSPNELTNLEDKSIGREHAPLRGRITNTPPLPDSYEDLLNKIKSQNEIRYHITRHYLTEMRDAFTEIARATALGGHVVIVTGNNSVCGETLRNDLFATEILTNSGLVLETSLIDHIKSRGLMTKRNKTASIISRESVLIFSK